MINDLIARFHEIISNFVDFTNIGVASTIILLIISLVIDRILRPKWIVYKKSIIKNQDMSGIINSQRKINLEIAEFTLKSRPYIAALGVFLIMIGSPRSDGIYALFFLGFYLPALYLSLHYIFLGHRYPKDFDDSQD